MPSKPSSPSSRHRSRGNTLLRSISLARGAMRSCGEAPHLIAHGIDDLAEAEIELAVGGIGHCSGPPLSSDHESLDNRTVGQFCHYRCNKANGPDRLENRHTLHGIRRQLARPCRRWSMTCARRCSAMPRAAARRPATSTPRPASCWRASASRRCSIPARRFWSCRALAAQGVYGEDLPGAGLITGIGRVVGPRVHGGGERPDREGRHLLSAHREEAPARAGDRRRERVALHLPGGERRRLSAAAGRGVSRTASTSAAYSSIRRGSRRRASRRSPWCTAPAPRAAPTCPPCRITPSSCAIRAGCFWAARRWCARRPARRSTRSLWAARMCIAAAPASPITTRRTTRMRWRSRAAPWRGCAPRDRCSAASRAARRRGRRASLRSGGDSTASFRRPRASPTTCAS